jgi:phenylalanyl-tRNA synthetase beta chain
MTRDVRLFEIGRAFQKVGGRTEEADGRSYVLPQESDRVAGVITGARRPAHWSEPHPPDTDLFDARAMLESVVALARPGAVIAPQGDGWVVTAEGAVVGRAAELDADRPAWAGALFGFELEPAASAAQALTVRPLPAWPAIERDVALLLPDGVTAGEVEATLRRGAGPLCERLRVFDEYRGQGLPAGTRSVAWRLVFRAVDRTLREDEADKALDKALRTVEHAHGIRRREA